MYLVHLKSMMISALRQTFDEQYPEPDFRGLHVSIEYPIEAQDYPSIWCDYEDTRQLQAAGINYKEVNVDTLTGSTRTFTRWRFAGYVSFTVVALTSLERDRLYDELIRIMAFNHENPSTGEFRSYVEHNELIACNMDFDQIEPRGNAAAPGTPWGTDEIIYERTVNMEVLGEFVSDGITRALVPLREVDIHVRREDEPDLWPEYTNVDLDDVEAWH